MDRNTAIERLNKMRRVCDMEGCNINCELCTEALDLAIEALGEPTVSENESVEGDAGVATTTDCISRAGTIEAICAECDIRDCCRVCTPVAVVEGMPSCNKTCNKKQVTGKLENAETVASEGEESTIGQPKSKLESEQMREYIPKGEVLDIIKSMPMDLVNEYVYELDGIWIDEEEVDYCNNCPYISYNNEDCISRQQAIEEIKNATTITGWNKYASQEEIVDDVERQLRRLFVGAIESLPPVTPAVSEDCISRAELLKDFGCSELTRKYGGDHSGYDTYMIYEIQDIIEDAPSVTPTENTGEWIPVTKVYRTTEADFPKTHIEWETATEPDEIDAFRCSECGEVFDFEDARNWCTECEWERR